MGLEPYAIMAENNPISEHCDITPTCNLLITIKYKNKNNGGPKKARGFVEVHRRVTSLFQFYSIISYTAT